MRLIGRNILIIICIIVGSFVIYNRLNRDKVNYIKVSSIDQINEIWRNYHNHNISNDVQVVRSISPYKNLETKEGNQVVTNDKNIYSISNENVVITNVDSLEVKNRLHIDNFKPLLLYVTGDKLIVIGEKNKTTSVYIYEKDTLKELNNFSIEATYITSRLIDDELYIISSKILKDKERPKYYENGIEKVVPYGNIIYVENTYSNNYVNIMKANINSNKDNLLIKSYLGLGQIIYFSKDNIYLAEEKFAEEYGTSNKTIIIKIDNEKLNLQGATEVNGYVLDKDSLNEYRGKLRVATTSHENNKQNNNNIYVLNEKMKIIGKLEKFSTGQEIQAAVFIEDKAYIETFNILDPFYVIDLKNEKKPKIVSELKFDGYNTNFIPYDKNNIIAFGLVLDKDKQPIGLKVSLYDVSNPKKVKIKDKVTFMYDEYNSAYSEVLYDCKSLLLDKENRILGFPIIYWIKEKNKPAYYKQFYAVYKLNNELTQLGKISHYEAGKENGSNDIKRGLVINKNLFTVSDRLIMKNNLEDLKLVKKSYLSTA